MATVLKSFLGFLRNLLSTRSFIHQAFRRWAFVLTLLGRRLGIWCVQNNRRQGTIRRDEQSERLFPGMKEHGIAASHAPASSHPSLHDASGAAVSRQISPAASSASSGATPPVPTNLIVQPLQDRAYPSSIRSRASNASSIRSGASRQTRFPRASHRQFGRGPPQTPSPSPSRERRGPSKSPSPSDCVPRPPRLEIDTTNLRPPALVDGPINPPSATSHTHVPLSPPSIYGHRRRLSSGGVIVGIESPSTPSQSLRSPLTDRPPLTEEPYTIGSSSSPSPLVAATPDAREALSLNSFPTSSRPPTPRPPHGRRLEMIHSEQVPRYVKDAPV